jgi:hypothetical protein
MSDEHQSTIPNGTPTVAELAEQLKNAQATNARLLEESKKHKERARLSDSELERLSEETNGKEKDVNKIIDAANKKAEKIANENKKLRSETLNSRIRSVISKYAEGVIDLDDLLNQPKYGDILKKGIDVDELTVDEDIAKSYVEAVLKDKPYLKKQSDATTLLTKRPSFQLEKGKTLASMTTKEIEEMAINLYGNK